jgi:hypothetical protein
MAKYACTGILFLLFLFPLHCIDYTDVIRSTDRSHNDLIIRVITSVTLNERIKIIKALGQRDDPYIEDILYSLINQCAGRKKKENEYLIRVLFHGMFSPLLEEEMLLSRLLANKEVITNMIQHLHVFDDPMLKCQVLWIIPYFHDISLNSAVMSEGNRLLALCKKKNGMPGTLVDEEIIAFLELAAVVGNTDFLDICISFRNQSRTKQVVEKAREVSKLLVKREK